MMAAFYNDTDRYCCDWLSNLMDAGLITPGKIDDRSISDLGPADVAGFRRVHLFAGVGGWEYALRLAGWPANRPIWTGSCPCQPFSVAGKRAGVHDKRHLWPDFFRLIGAVRPAVVMGEQVAGKSGYGWLDGVRVNLAGEGYACRGVDIPACSVDAPHIRNRIYWVAVVDADEPRLEGWRKRFDEYASERTIGATGSSALGDASSATAQLFRETGELQEETSRTQGEGHQREWGWNTTRHPGDRNGAFWSDAEWVTGADGKSRRVARSHQSEVCSLASRLSAGMDGLRSDTIPLLVQNEPARVGKLRALGNAIVPQLAAEVIRSLMESER